MWSCFVCATEVSYLDNKHSLSRLITRSSLLITSILFDIKTARCIMNVCAQRFMHCFVVLRSNILEKFSDCVPFCHYISSTIDLVTSVYSFLLMWWWFLMTDERYQMFMLTVIFGYTYIACWIVYNFVLNCNTLNCKCTTFLECIDWKKSMTLVIPFISLWIISVYTRTVYVCM